jgi:hypothetical protein
MTQEANVEKLVLAFLKTGRRGDNHRARKHVAGPLMDGKGTGDALTKRGV